MKDFGNEDVKLVCQHFHQSLSRVVPDISPDSMVVEWNLLKKLVTRKYGDTSALTWSTVFRNVTDVDQIMLLIDLMLTILSTSVSCETAFSQLKLLKTSRRSRLGTALLNDLMVVKLESPEIAEFDPDDAINTWLAGSIMGRRTSYKAREKKVSTKPQPETVVIHHEEDDQQSQELPPTEIDNSDEQAESEAIESSSYNSLVVEIAMLCDKDTDDDTDIDEECFDFQDEVFNFEKLLMFARGEYISV